MNLQLLRTWPFENKDEQNFKKWKFFTSVSALSTLDLQSTEEEAENCVAAVPPVTWAFSEQPVHYSCKIPLLHTKFAGKECLPKWWIIQKVSSANWHVGRYPCPGLLSLTASFTETPSLCPSCLEVAVYTCFLCVCTGAGGAEEALEPVQDPVWAQLQPLGRPAHGLLHRVHHQWRAGLRLQPRLHQRAPQRQGLPRHGQHGIKDWQALRLRGCPAAILWLHGQRISPAQGGAVLLNDAN